MNDETWKRLQTDAEFLRQCVDLLIGPPHSDRVSSSGFTEYPCPFPGCGGGHFGVCYAPGRFRLGAWSCFKCGASGPGLGALGKSLGADWQESVRLALGEDPPKAAHRPPPLTVPLEAFDRVWRPLWLEGRISPQHEAMLLSRGVEQGRTNSWFTVPGDTTRVSRFVGLSASADASLTYEDGTPSLFARPGRLAIVYPRRPWREDGSALFIASYARGERRKILRPKGVSLSGILYYRGFPSGPDTLVITEGEIKAEASYQAGVPTIGLPGVSTGHGEVAEVLRYLGGAYGHRYRRLLIVFDGDEKESSRTAVDRCASRLTQTLRDSLRGDCPSVERLTLPGEGKVDIDSFLETRIPALGLEASRRQYRDLVLGDQK